MVAIDFEDVETGKIEAGSGIKSAFPCAILSSRWVSLDCESGDCGCWWDSNSRDIIGVSRADGTGEVNGKELEERRDICSGVHTDADSTTCGTTATGDISSPTGEGETGACDTLVFGVGGACDSGMEVELERDERGERSAMNSDSKNIKRLVEQREQRNFACT